MAAPFAIDITNPAMEAIRSGDYDTVADAPPGSGKTTLLVDLMALTGLMLSRTALVAAVSNNQCDDITYRAATMYPRLRIDRFVAAGASKPALSRLSNVRVVDKVDDLTAQIVVGSVMKFAEIKDLGYCADELFIDEAYQARRADYDRVRSLAKKACLIGDPGQIRPIHQSDIRLYAADPCGPHVAAPLVLLNNGAAMRLQMRHSRRLPQDTVEVLQPSFYPQLPFTSLAAPGRRRITGGLKGMTPIDRLLDEALRKGSLSMLALPTKVVARFDHELIGMAVELVKRLLQRQFQFIDDDETGTLEEKDIGVVAIHRDEVTAIRQAVGPNVFVETAHRFQGLERKVIIALHPLSGAERVTGFNAEAGLSCVALSRHRIACIVVAREGIAKAIDRAVLEEERYLGSPDDPLYEGIRAHRTLIEEVERRRLVVRP